MYINNAHIVKLAFYAHTDRTISEAVVKNIENLTDFVICAYCSFTAGSEAEGCAVELESEAHTYLFNMSRSTSGGGELSESVLDCFTVGEAGGYSVHVYEIQCNGELGHRRRELPDIKVDTIKQDDIDEERTNNTCTRSLTATQSNHGTYIVS